VTYLPPLNALRAFEAAARHLSFKMAAKELCVTPAAVSRHVANLEKFLGTALFVRNNREVLLTLDGRNYLREIGEAFERIAHATTALGSSNEKVLRLKLPPTCAARWLVPRLAGFHAMHPDIHVQIATTHDPVDLWDDGVDLAITYGRNIAAGVVGELLFNEVLIPVCSRSVAQTRAFSAPRDLAGQVLLHSLRRPQDWPHWFKSTGMNDIAIEKEIVFEDSILTLQGAMDGLGVAIAQKAFVASELESGRLVSPIEIPLRTDFSYFAVSTKEKLRHRKNRLFQDWLSAECAGIRPH
jgi:LysR family glycine cleavage system transcriptional activator